MVEFTTRQFAGQFVDQEDVAPDELRAALLALQPAEPIITLKTSPVTDGVKSWLLIARAETGGLNVVTGSGHDWTTTSGKPPDDAVMTADWYPLDAVERVGLEVSNLEHLSKINAKFSHTATWHIHLRGRDKVLTLDHEPERRSGIVEAFVRRLIEDRSGSSCAEEDSTAKD